MKFNILSSSDFRISFELSDVDVPLLNAIRRYVMMHVPVLAVDSIVVYENSTSLFDEYIAHRMGMIPVKTPKKLPKEVNVVFTLDITGPKEVYSEDVKSTDDEITYAVEGVPIIKLLEGQNLKLEGKLKLGKGLEHAKYQPGLFSYGYDKEGKYSAFVESYYNMPAEDLLYRGLEALEDDCDSLIKELKKKVKTK